MGIVSGTTDKRRGIGGRPQTLNFQQLRQQQCTTLVCPIIEFHRPPITILPLLFKQLLIIDFYSVALYSLLFTHFLAAMMISCSGACHTYALGYARAKGTYPIT